MKECCEQLVRMDNIAATFAMGIDDPTPAISGNGAVITPLSESAAPPCPKGTEIMIDRISGFASHCDALTP